MSTPQTNGNGDLLAQLPADIQAIIRAEVEKALAAQAQAAAPRELTPQEKAALYLDQAAGGLRGEKQISAGSLYVHSRIIDLLAILIEQVFPADASDAAVASNESEAV